MMMMMTMMMVMIVDCSVCMSMWMCVAVKQRNVSVVQATVVASSAKGNDLLSRALDGNPLPPRTRTRRKQTHSVTSLWVNLLPFSAVIRCHFNSADRKLFLYSLSVSSKHQYWNQSIDYPQFHHIRKGKNHVELLLMELHLTATECHLPYGITQCYLPPITSEHTPP